MTRIVGLLTVLVALLGPRVGLAQFCLGDCNGNERVEVNELVIGVRIALGVAELSYCSAFDDGSGEVTISVLIVAVRHAVNGCGAATPTATTEPVATPTVGANEIFQGALVRSSGRFTYQGTVGIDGANAECAAQFPGAHACTIAELRAAEAAAELSGAQDTAGNAVATFWAIDPSRAEDEQCHVNVPWDYATAHTGQFADLVELNNATGALSVLQENKLCATQHWVGCCL